MKIVDSEQFSFFVCYNESLSKHLFKFYAFLTCEGTSFLCIKPLDDPLEEQLEDGLKLFFELIFA